MNLRNPQALQSQCPYDPLLARKDEDGKPVPGPSRSGRGTREPVIITPYDTVRGGKPISFSWQAVPGAMTYSVILRSSNGVWLDKSVPATDFRYPRDPKDKPLAPGNYTLQVEAEDISDPQPGTKFFRVLSEEDAGKVSQIEDRLKQLPLSTPSERDQLIYLDLDPLYIKYRLLDDAIASLSQQVQAGSQTPQVYRILGDRYVDAGQLDLALQQYEQAIQLAKKVGNTLELERSHQRLEAIKQAMQPDPEMQ